MSEQDISNIADIDLYEVLDVNINSKKDKIKKNYKELIKRLHPDKKDGDSEAFQLVNLAYNILKNKKLRRLYNEKRKEILNSSTFHHELKKNFNDKSSKKIFMNKDDAKLNFNELTKTLNEKHGFNSSDINKLTSSQLKSRLNKLMFERTDIIQSAKKGYTKKKSLSKADFNEEFINDGIKESNNSTDIMAYNMGTNSHITKYNDINNFDLYSSKGSNNLKYSSIDDAFNQSLPKNISNNYSNHNIITKEDRERIKNRMSKYKNNIN